MTDGDGQARCKCKQDSVGVRRILVVPRDSGGASAGFCWCIWGEMADEVSVETPDTLFLAVHNPQFHNKKLM